MERIEKFFCVSLRTASQILAWMYVILFFLGGILLSWIAANPEVFVEPLIESWYKDSEQEIKDCYVGNVSRILWLVVIELVCGFFTAILFLIGLSKRQPNFMPLWIILTGHAVIFSVAVLLISASFLIQRNLFFPIVLPAIVIDVVFGYAYWAAVLYYYYHKLKEQSSYLRMHHKSENV